MEFEPMDLSITDESLPIDLSINKRKSPDFHESSSKLPEHYHQLMVSAEPHETSKPFEHSHERLLPDQYGPSKLPEFCRSLRVDIPMPVPMPVPMPRISSSSFYFGGSLIKSDGPPFETNPGLLSPPLECESPCRLTDVGDWKENIVPPMTSSLILYSPLSIEPPYSPTNSLGSASGIPPLLASPGPDISSTILDEQALYSRDNGSSRHFNILAKKIMDGCTGTDPVLQAIITDTGESSYVKLPRRCDNGGDLRDSEHRSHRTRNNLAARKSRARRKMKADLLIQTTARYKQESSDMLREIVDLQRIMLERGYQNPLPFQEEINRLCCEVDVDPTL